MKKSSDKIITISIILFILCFAISFFLIPKKEYSDNENRYLAKTPSFTISNLIDGDYTEGIKDYLTDHFPARDFFISFKTLSEEIIGKKKINGVYLASDDYLIGEYKNPQNTQRIIESFKNFSKRIKTSNPDVNLKLMLVPTKFTILSDKLPLFAGSSLQMDTLNEIAKESSIDFVDPTDYLIEASHKNEIYFRTDHHWNGYGAYAGYKAFCDSSNDIPSSLDEYEIKTVTNDFHGTLSAKVNRFYETGDEIDLFINKSAQLTVTYEDSGEISNSLYNLDYLEKRDKYSLFLNNLHPLVIISNANTSSDRVLMLIKDSYANCMIPFLVGDFSKIYVFDTRYYKDGPGNYFEEHTEITDVLLLYNMNTLDTDTGIRGIF